MDANIATGTNIAYQKLCEKNPRNAVYIWVIAPIMIG
jgi:hypothetical protein